ncbi:unnamed protein product [Gongylonema pulchrum]|uniref:Uncharacterized protein n=1 Tax=Gongylonema pulchrum TaxID=637853 RepID=A0A183CW83_9BILA|nr:unnamed protein product [Gongylonema pulchrum]
MPLTRELLQQHTRKWEQEYRDTWKKRLGLKRPTQRISKLFQQTEFTVPVSSKIFRDNSGCSKPTVTQSAPACLSSTRTDHWPTVNRGEYYRSLGPNPPPPPGRNFQITSVPLPPPLPIEDRRSAFVSLPITATTKLFRDASQPINLSVTEQLQARGVPEPTSIATGTEGQPVFQPPPQQHRSVIRTALMSSTQKQQQQQYCGPDAAKLPPPATPVAHRQMPTTTLDMVFDWGQTLEYSNGAATTEPRETCAARLINMAQRAQQQQQQLGQKQQQQQVHLPLANSPVKEATDALMLLQETTTF